MPTAKNPKLQEPVENAYKWDEKTYLLSQLRMRKDKLALEQNQHKQELAKFSRSAKDFPPYRDCGLSDKFDEACRAIKDQLKVAEDERISALEQFIASMAITNTSKPVAVDHQDPLIAALEAKVEKISQQAASQNKQIQSLLEENKRLGVLKSEHDAMQSKIRTYDDRIQVLESQQEAINAENKNLKEQLQDLRCHTEGNFELHNTELAKLTKQTSDIADAPKVSAIDLDERVSGIEAGFKNDFKDYVDIKEKVDELDLSTLNELCSAWGEHTWGLRILEAEYEEYRDQTGSSFSETLRSLDQAVKSLQASPASAPPPHQEPHLSVEILEEALDAKIEAARKLIAHEYEEYSQGRDNIIASMIDDHGKQINTLDARVRSLEDSFRMEQSQGPNLAKRLSLLEEGNVGGRINQTEVDISKLSRDYEALLHDVGQLPNREWVEGRLLETLDNVGVYPRLVNEARDIQRKLSQLESAIVNLDRLYQNINTKSLADHIVKLTSPAVEQRLGKLETKANVLETKVNQISAERRTASPGQLEEPSKKRKLGDVNGRHPSPLQQQQRNNITRNSTS